MLIIRWGAAGRRRRHFFILPHEPTKLSHRLVMNGHGTSSEYIQETPKVNLL